MSASGDAAWAVVREVRERAWRCCGRVGTTVLRADGRWAWRLDARDGCTVAQGETGGARAHEQACGERSEGDG